MEIPFEPVVRPENSKHDFNKPTDLGVAIGRFFRTQGLTDSIAATEKIEGTEFPIQLPPVEWTEPVRVYDRFHSREYLEMIQAMTREIGGN